MLVAVRRERLHWAWAEEVEDRPGLPEGVLKQELEGGEDHGCGRAGDVFLRGEIEEIPAQLVFGDLVR